MSKHFFKKKKNEKGMWHSKVKKSKDVFANKLLGMVFSY